MTDLENRDLRKNYYISIIFLIFLLTFFFIVWQISKNHFTKKTEENFIEYSNDIKLIYGEESEKFYSLLDYGINLFKVNNTVTRSNFENYYSEAIESHNKKFNNINFIAYVEKVTSKDEFEKKVRNEQTDVPFKNIYFSIYPKVDRSEYWVINYMTPNDPNKEYFGYDVLSDSEFSDYFIKAAREKSIIVTDPKIFIKNKQLLIVKPIYDQKQSLRNEDERLKALNGFIVLFINPEKLFPLISDFSENNSNIYSHNTYVYYNHIEKNQISAVKPIYEDIFENLNYLKTEQTQKLKNITYGNFGDKEITIYTEADINGQPGVLEGVVCDVIFITSSIIIVIFFLMMVDMNYLLVENNKQK